MAVVGNDAAVGLGVRRPGLDVGLEVAPRADKDEVGDGLPTRCCPSRLLFQPGQEEEREEGGGERVDLDGFFAAN